MTDALSLDELWDSAPSGPTGPPSRALTEFPEAAQRYLRHAIAPGVEPATAVRLRMHGELKLREWLPFKAEQVIHRRRGMIWKATVRWHFIPIRGSDRVVDGWGSMRWKLFGLVPVMTASGHDITRSAVDRLRTELVLLPSALSADDASWMQLNASTVRVRLPVQGEMGDLTLTIDPDGRIQTFQLPRWGDPDGTGFHYATFGGIVEEEGTFQGYTIPTRLRVGWHFGTDRFETDGEFFRCTMDDAVFR